MLKGIVHHPRINILSLFTHPHVVPDYMCFFLKLNIKEDSLRNAGSQAVDGPH